MAIELIIFGIALLGASIITFWEEIVHAVRGSIFPWIRKHFPSIAETVKQAFDSIDKVAVAIRRQIKTAWKNLRKRLLKVVVKFEHRGSKWFRVIVSWLIKNLEDKKIHRRIEEEEVSYDDLPDEFRKQWMRHQNKEQDITQVRDQQIEAMTL